MSVRFLWSSFDDLGVTQLYALLRLRAEVFVVEQHCPFVDPDGLDPLAWHLLAWDGAHLAGCARVFPPSSAASTAHGAGSASLASGEVSVGRIVTAGAYRGSGLGRALMQEVMQWVEVHHPGCPIRLGAQARLRAFYEDFGFVRSGPVYLEDGITHITMQKQP